MICPYSGCGVTVCKPDVEKLLKDDNKNVFICCPGEDCPHIFEYTIPIKNPKSTCPDCGIDYCLNCRTKWTHYSCPRQPSSSPSQQSKSCPSCF